MKNIMAFDKIIGTSVGADLSALRGFRDILPILFMCIMFVPLWL